VNLTSDDDAAALSSLGIKILSDTGASALKQSCAAYKNRLCNVYRHRPHGCRNFRCALLKAFEKNDLSHAEALKIIREAVELRDEMQRDWCAVFGDDDYTFRERAARLKTSWKNAVSAEAKDRAAKLFARFAALWMYVNKHFVDQRQR
jgi:Fe-S-cluster containining protein